MTDLVTLVCPEGAGRIAHGPVDFKPYRANHLDPASVWLVDVPPEAAEHLIHTGGLYMADQTELPMVPAGMAKVRMTDGSGGGCTYGSPDSVAYPADAKGVVLVPVAAVAELCESHGFEVVPDEPKGEPKNADKAESPTVRRVPRG